MDHTSTKNTLLAEGKSMGLTKGDISVLSRDPFFVGSPKEYEDARWAAGLWDKMMSKRRKPLHLRGFHYWVQSQGIAKPDGVKYAHVDPSKDWMYLLTAVQIARYLGIGEWTNLVDLKHPDPVDHDNYYIGTGFDKTGDVDIQELLNTKAEGLVDEIIRELVREAPAYQDDGYQMYHMEVLCEKNSMGFVIEPACRKYNACYQAFVGQASVEKIQMMTNRAIRAHQAGKHVRIFYIADYDRYGWSMVTAVARKVEFMLEQAGVTDTDAKLTRLALNEDHINKFNLPKAPKHGEAVVELDALEAIHPGALGKIVEDALRPYYDAKSVQTVREENRRIREAVREMVEENLRGPLEEVFKNVDITKVAGDIDISTVVDPDFELPEPEHEINDDGDHWVLDTSLDYWAQFERYKKYKGDRVEEEM
jgi:chloramphenicol 3-O-phosphotransferase